MARSFTLGVLGSGKGSNFRSIYQAIQDGKLASSIGLVASDFADAGILDFSKEKGLPGYTIPRGKFKTKLEPEIELQLAEELKKADVDLVILAGYMRVVKAPLLEAFPGKILNIHPSLLPAFPGLKAWEQALNAGVEEAGCSVHWVNEVIDGGAIIDQEKVPVRADDTAESLHARIQEKEHILYPRVIRSLELQEG